MGLPVAFSFTSIRMLMMSAGEKPGEDALVVRGVSERVPGRGLGKDSASTSLMAMEKEAVAVLLASGLV
jgi:hypothetical protein